MAVALVFWTFLLSAFVLVFWYGGWIERAFAGFLLACTLVTFALNAELGLFETQNVVFAIDVAIFVVVLKILRTSPAYWPVWFAGFHAIIVATGLARLLFPSAVPAIYINAAGFWSLPVLLVLVLGTLADHKLRTAAQVDAR